MRGLTNQAYDIGESDVRAPPIRNNMDIKGRQRRQDTTTTCIQLHLDPRSCGRFLATTERFLWQINRYYIIFIRLWTGFWMHVFPFCPCVFTTDLNPATAGVRVGSRSISSTLTPAIPVYFRTISVFIYKRSWPEHAPVCRFHPPPPTPPILSSPSLLYLQASSEISSFFPLPVLLLLLSLSWIVYNTHKK